MNKISYEEYLEALAKVKLFHLQLEKEILEVKIELEINKGNAVERGIIELLAQNATNRLLYAVKHFLACETSYRKISYSSAEDVPVVFYTEKYTIEKLKPVRNIGSLSLKLLNRILRHRLQNAPGV